MRGRSACRAEIAWLQAQGINVWWEEGITHGAESRRAELVGAIRDSALLIYVVTPRSVASVHFVRDVGVALDEFALPVAAVHLEPVRLPDTLVLPMLGRQASLRYEQTFQEYAVRLGTALFGRLAHSRAFAPESHIGRHSRLFAATLGLGVGLGLIPGMFYFVSGVGCESTPVLRVLSRCLYGLRGESQPGS